MKVSIADRKEKGEAQKEAAKEAAKHVQLYKPSVGAERAKADLMQLTMQIPDTPLPTAQEKKVEESKTGEEVPQQVVSSPAPETKNEEVKTV